MGGKAHSNSSPLWYPLLLSNIPGTLFLVFLPSASMWLKAALCMQYPTDLSKHLHSTVQYNAQSHDTYVRTCRRKKRRENRRNTSFGKNVFKIIFSQTGSHYVCLLSPSNKQLLRTVGKEKTGSLSNPHFHKWVET